MAVWDFIFYFWCDGLREKPKALRSVHVCQLCHHHDSASMSSSLYVTAALEKKEVDGFRRLARSIAWNPNSAQLQLINTRMEFNLWLQFFNWLVLAWAEPEFPLTFCFDIFLSSRVRRLSPIAKNTRIVFSWFLFVFLFFYCLCFFIIFGCWSLFLWHEKHTNRSSEEKRIKFLTANQVREELTWTLLRWGGGG